MAVSDPSAKTSSTVLRDALVAATTTVTRNALRFGTRFPGDTTTAARYRMRPAQGPASRGGNYGWTTSFWTGMQWIAWQLTGDPALLATARQQSADFVRRIRERQGIDTHDLGFLYSLSCVTSDRLVGDPDGRAAALNAARHLIGRFLPAAGIVQAWGELGDQFEQGRTIIDSLMNMPLLSWAGKTNGDPRYHQVVQRHVSQLCDHIIRPDGSTFHTYQWDAATGRPLFGGTAQGASDTSCWARGQAWGIYGFALNARSTGDPAFVAASRRCADYFLAHLPSDAVPYWDLVFPHDSAAPRDSSAAAIAASGLQELAGLLGAEDASAGYAAAADRILVSLAEDYTPDADHPSDALLLHGVYDFPGRIGVDEGTLWGDYFYLEALQRRLHPNWQLPW